MSDVIMGSLVAFISGISILTICHFVAKFSVKVLVKNPIKYFAKDFYDHWDDENKPKGWYFYDETWANLYGPYKRKREVKKAFKKYCLLNNV